MQHDAVHEVCRHRVEDFPVLAFRILYARSSRQVEFADVCLAKKNFSAEIIEIFWDTMSHSKFFMAEIEDKQSLKMSISAAFQTTFNRFPCLHAHPALTSTAAKLLLVAKDRLSRNSFEISQTPYYSRAPTPTPIDPKHANCPLFSSLSIVASLHGDLVVRFPTPLPPGSDIPIHVSWGTRL